MGQQRFVPRAVIDLAADIAHAGAVVAYHEHAPSAGLVEMRHLDWRCSKFLPELLFLYIYRLVLMGFLVVQSMCIHL
jgi:hypothetical protein